MAEPVAAALTAEDYQQLHAMLLSADAGTRTEGLTLAKKLTPNEQQQFFIVQQQANRGKLANREDVNMATVGPIGIPPEAMLLGPAQAGRALLGPGSMAQRGMTAGSELWKSAHPILKYEVARHGLQALGLPASVSTVLAMVWSGRGATKAAPEATRSVSEAVDEAVASGQLRRAPGWTPESGPLTRPPKVKIATPAVESMSPAPAAGPSAPRSGPRTINEAMEEAIAKATAAKAAPPTSAPSPAQATSTLLTNASTVKLKLTAAEVKTGADLIRAGKTPSEALDAIQAMRTFAQKFNLPASAEVKAVVKERNAAGEWGEKK